MNARRHCLFILILLLVIMAMPALAADSSTGEIAYGSNPQAGHYASVNGIDMYYETYGSGAFTRSDPLGTGH